MCVCVCVCVETRAHARKEQQQQEGGSTCSGRGAVAVVVVGECVTHEWGDGESARGHSPFMLHRFDVKALRGRDLLRILLRNQAFGDRSDAS